MRVLNVILARFFTEEDHVRFFRSGNIRMMSAKYYKDLEEVSTILYTNRYDALENSTYVLNPNKDGEIILKNAIKLGDDSITRISVGDGVELINPIVISNDSLDKITKILCLYMIPRDEIKDNKVSSVISTMKESLGDYYCLITDTAQFVSKVESAISKLASKGLVRNGEFREVDYVDENNFCGFYGPFRKPSGLSWQKEFRFKLETLDKEPFIIDIGNIEKISIWGKVSDLKNALIYEDGSCNIPNFRW